MVIIEITYIKSLSEVGEFLDAHIKFLEKYYEQRIFIASGRKIPRDGGVILALTDKSSAAEIIKEDPFHQYGIAKYHLIEFLPSKHDPRLREILS